MNKIKPLEILDYNFKIKYDVNKLCELDWRFTENDGLVANVGYLSFCVKPYLDESNNHSIASERVMVTCFDSFQNSYLFPLCCNSDDDPCLCNLISIITKYKLQSALEDLASADLLSYNIEKINK
jgi:hypothetical protein